MSCKKEANFFDFSNIDFSSPKTHKLDCVRDKDTLAATTFEEECL